MHGFLSILSDTQECPLSAEEDNTTLLKRAVWKRAQPVSQGQGFSPFTPHPLDHVGMLRPVWYLPYEQYIDQSATRMIRYWIACCGRRS